MAIRREHVPVTEERKVLLRAGGLCESCREPTARFELDHIIPVAVGGKSDASNIQALCLRCHKRKSKKFAPKLAKVKRISRSLQLFMAVTALKTIESGDTGDRAASIARATLERIGEL